MRHEARHPAPDALGPAPHCTTFFRDLSTQCSTSVDYTHRVATLEALPGVVVLDELTPPTVVKPLASNQYYCIIAGADPSDGRTDTDATYTTIRGYVQSGTAPTSPFTSKGHTATGF